jgi:hypothetical protein
MLPIENKVKPITSAYLYGIDLVEIKVRGSPADVEIRYWALIRLVGKKVSDRNQFEMHIGHISWS